jgi:putative heme transporter
VVPGGAAVNVATQYGMLRNWGFEGRPVVLAVSATTLWSQFATFVFPVVAIALLSLDGGQDVMLRTVALAGLVLVAILAGGVFAVLWSPQMAKEIGEKTARIATRLNAIIHKGPVQWNRNDVVRIRSDALDLLRHRWAALTTATLANQLTVFLVLVLSLRALQITRSEVDVVEAFAAWSLVRALGSIPITPGGLGIVEVALSGALVGFGAGHAQAVAATLVYRFLTVVPSIVLGLASVATYNVKNPKAKLARRPADAALQPPGSG